MRLVTGAVVALVALSPPAPARQVHEDVDLGFKIRAPKEFDPLPVKPTEEWIVARWQGSKAYYQTDPTTGYSADLKPEMNVIAFVDAVINADKVEIEKKTDEKTSVIKIKLNNPYKDYRAYLKGTYNEGGFYIEKEERAEVEGVKVECLEIKVERGTWGGPRKIVTWIFDGPDAHFAVQFELFESAWPKLKNDVLSTMRSFRVIPRTGSGGPAPATGGPGPVVIDLDADLDDLTPAARARTRREQEKRAQERATKGLVGEWRTKTMGRCFVLFNVDEKNALEFANGANAVMDYLDDEFAWLGTGEYVRSPTIRVCKDYDEERMYSKGGGGFFYDWTAEIVTHKDNDKGWSFSEAGYVNARICEHWFRERSGELYDVMPYWLQTGLNQAFRKSRPKGRKLEFFNDSWERVDIAEQIRAGKLSPLKEILKLDSYQVYKDWNKSDECAAATRFMLTGPKKAKEALKTYLQSLVPVAKKREEKLKEMEKAAEAAAKGKKPKTEEEEDAEFKAANTKLRDSEKKELEEAFLHAFGAWTDADWKSLDAAYQKSLK